MNKIDARRLTGFNVIWKYPSAVVDVALDEDENAEQVIQLWHLRTRELLDAVGWFEEHSAAHRFATGVSLALSAPIDSLYAAVELAERAYAEVEAILLEQPLPDDKDAEVARLLELIHAEQNPAMLSMEARAAMRDLMFLWDDDEVSVGMGRGSKTWPVDGIEVSADLSSLSNIPIGLVTGTNGKTTTVRLSQHILRTSGLNVGISSTDWIGVNGEIIDLGDYSGPGGARTVLRQTNVDTAILETARGGLLRRGLGVPRADAVLITNIAEDHLGDFGSQNLDELLSLKWIATQALDQSSVAILNADDPMLVAKASELSVPIVWFSLDSDSKLLRDHMHSGGQAVSIVDKRFSRFDGRNWHILCAVNEVPITVDGTARHNVANALAAIALTHALSADDAAIAQGLTSMALEDNPGRCNFFQIDGYSVLLDFAHNPSAMAAIFNLAQHHPAKRRILCFGQAGDRTDALIIEMARLAWEIGLDRVMISELADYYRGREPGEVFSLLCQGLTEAGAKDSQIAHFDTEQQALAAAMDEAKEGDLIIMLALAESRQILENLQSLSSTE